MKHTFAVCALSGICEHRLLAVNIGCIWATNLLMLECNTICELSALSSGEVAEV